MAKSGEWFGENPYNVEIGVNGELVLIRTDTDSLIDVKKEALPSSSATKQLLKDLKD